MLWHLAEANLGRDNLAAVSDRERTIAALEVLSLTHADQLERCIDSATSYLVPAADSGVQIATARLNSRLMFSTSGDIRHTPGCIFQFPLRGRLAKRFIEPATVQENWHAAKWAEKAELVAGKNPGEWVLVDVTAPCDRAQRKHSRARLCVGLVTSKKLSKGTLHGHIYCLNAFRRNATATADEYVFVDFSTLTVVDLSEYARLKPLFSLRGQVLNDLLYHLGGNLSRPGMVSI